MARVTEQELKYCPRLTLQDVCEHFGEHASTMLRHYKNRQIDNCMEQDAIRNNEELTAEQKAIGLVFLKWLNDESLVNNAVRHLERIVWMRRKVYYDNQCPPGKMYYMNLPVEQVKAIPFLEVHNFENIKKTGRRTMVSCPFHGADSSPSMLIRPNNTAYCFGCQFNGDTVAFIQKLHNLDFIRAVKWLQGIKK